MKILSFGEIIWDVYENESFIGGAPLNLAAHCSKQGAKSFMLSSVGNDDLGKDALELVKNFNVNTDFVSINEEKETEGTIRRKQLEKMAKDKPEDFAKLLRSWITED